MTLSVGTLVLHTTRQFLLNQQAKSTSLALAGNRLVIHCKAAARVLITGIKQFSVARLTLHKVPLATLRASQLGILSLFLGRFDMLTVRISRAANEHAISPLAKQQFVTAIRAGFAQVFHHMAIIVVQRLDVVALGITRTPEKRTAFAIADNQLRPTLGTALLLLQRMLMS